jgi:hypothetical protein
MYHSKEMARLTGSHNDKQNILYTVTDIFTTHHEESATVIVLLQELVFALRCFVSDKLRVVPKLLPPLLFCHVAQPFYF